MKKLFLTLTVFCIGAALLCAQGSFSPDIASAGGASSEELSRMNAAVKGLAAELNKKLIEEKAGTVVLGEFAFEGAICPLSQYWANQLIEELVNLKGPYSVISTASADFLLSGEIIALADTIRVYSRLSRSSDKAFRAAFHSDLERNENTDQMLSAREGRRRSSFAARDALEEDSWDSPVSYEIGAAENPQFLNRTIHNGSDEDFFLLVPDRDGRLSMETTGSIDTFMELYDASSREMLTSDDDSGSGSNARIRYNVTAGKRYIIKVRGYDEDTTGQ